MTKQIKRMFQRIERWFSLVLAKGRITIADAEAPQVGFFTGEVQDKVPLVQHYGFKSIPPKGAVCIVVSNGTRESSVVIATKTKEEPGLKEGEAAFFAKNTVFKLSPDGTASLTNGKTDLIKLVDELLATLITAKVDVSKGVFTPDITLKLNEISIKWRSFVHP